MTRVLHGEYQQQFRGQPPGPYLSGFVVFDDRQLEVRFLIDTGADTTVLSPEDAADLLGGEVYRRLGVLFPDNRVSVTGVGVGDAVELPLTLVFRVPDERPLVFREPVLVAAAPGEPRATVPLPSLLGRDILNRFILLLNPATETVELTELDAASAG